MKYSYAPFGKRLHNRLALRSGSLSAWKSGKTNIVDLQNVSVFKQPLYGYVMVNPILSVWEMGSYFTSMLLSSTR